MTTKKLTFLPLVLCCLTPQLSLGVDTLKNTVYQGLTEPLTDQPLSKSQMMNIIYYGDHDNELWFLADGSDFLEVFLTSDLRSYSVSIITQKNDHVHCRTHHVFDYRWAGATCGQSIPLQLTHKLSVFDSRNHMISLFTCDLGPRVSMEANFDMILYGCRQTDNIELE